MSVQLDEIRRMSVTERLKLINDVWDTLVEEEAPPLSAAQAREVERRLEAYRQDDRGSISWEELGKCLEVQGL
jgi:putative addiction module component (TIGR02574 family)